MEPTDPDVFGDYPDDGEELEELPDGTNIDELAAYVKAAGPQPPVMVDWEGD